MTTKKDYEKSYSFLGRQRFSSVVCSPDCEPSEEGPTLHPLYGMEEEYYTILICHRLKKPLLEAWPRFKVWD